MAAVENDSSQIQIKIRIVIVFTLVYSRRCVIVLARSPQIQNPNEISHFTAFRIVA